MSKATDAAKDALLERMRNAREGSSVLKMDLVNLRAALPNTLILAFEGVDDKGIYYHWIRRISPEVDFEPFPCNGKSFVLELKRVVDRDVNGLGKGVYFFVDRDFDDLRGMQPDSSIFMTDHYSVENYLVSELVLSELLRNEFHCHAQPKVRDDAVNFFSKVYDDFLAITAPVNFRLYCARRLAIEVELPKKIGGLAAVELDSTKLIGGALEQIVKLEREPTDDEEAELRPVFDSLLKRERYRGKFATLFFLRWLEKLAADRVDSQSRLFPTLPKNVKVKLQAVSIDNLASKSALPGGLDSFVRSMSMA